MSGNHPPIPPAADADQESTRELNSHLPDEHIGPYRLLQKVGEGGMGEVWMAEQREPLRRTVAVKLIKIGMDTRQVVARFEAERQALALMDHPGIARVLDAGTSAGGRAYFVMEYVPGERITSYCDRQRLSTDERLQLFAHVCEAVQHAHQKGIIHRDLKPSNVLVALQDGRPVPKIIDFGIAKATAQRLTERTVFTELGVLIGTPEYMSPEQAEMTGLDVDTRTDVYSLGVMLYELLAGVLPFDPRTLREAGLDGVRRHIREVDPPRPSTKVSTQQPASAEAARNRRTEPARLARQLKGDLDWITMKCLEKDRSRRYASASELAADISRHLHHEPVQASPPGTVYRARKFVKRHRAGVAASVLVVLALVAGATGSTVGLLRARAAERRAAEEAEAARQVSSFLQGLFQVSEPNEAKGNAVTAREILDKGAERISRELQGQPRVRRRLLYIMGQVYQGLGLYGRSANLLEEALRVAREVGDYDSDVAGAKLDLAWLYRFQGRLPEAIRLTRDGIALRQREDGENHPDTARAERLLGLLLRDSGPYPEAQRLLERSVTILERSLGPGDKEVAASLYHLGWLLKLRGQPERAKGVYERALKIWEKTVGTDDTKYAWCLNDLAVVHDDLRNYSEARRLQEQALAIRIRLLGPAHPDVGASLNNLASVAWRQGDYKQALAFGERALTVLVPALGENHRDVAEAVQTVGAACEGLGDVSCARQHYDRALAIAERTDGPRSLGLCPALMSLGGLYEKTKARDAALAAYGRALAIYEAAPGCNPVDLAEARLGVARLAAEAGDTARALALFGRLENMTNAIATSDTRLAADILRRFSTLLRNTGQVERAAALAVRMESLATGTDKATGADAVPRQ